MNELERNLMLSSSEYINQKEYWLALMSDHYAKTTFFIDSNLQNEGKPTIENAEFIMSQALAASILRLCKNSDLSLYIMLLAALKTLIYRYTGNKDILVGSPVYNKIKTERTLNDLVVLRDDINGESSFKEFLLNVRKTTLDAYKNQDYPLYKIEDLGISEEDGYTGFFDVICSLSNIHGDLHENDLFNVFAFEREGENIQVHIRYNADSFIKRTMKQIWQDYTSLLMAIVADINTPLCRINFLSDTEENLLNSFNDTYAEFDKTKTLSEIFEEQAEQYANHIAVVYEEEAITYKELNERANQLARILRKWGVQQETIVAIRVDQSIHMIISILAVLKAGGAYLPIDASYPKDLVEYMLSDSGASILLTKKQMENSVKFIGTTVMLDDSNIYIDDDVTNLNVINNLHNTAYIIYTSGTTGRPKGVVVEQGNVLTYINAFYNEFNVSEKDTILVHASYSFDHFVEEVYPVLLKGGKLVIVKKSDILDIDVFANIVQRNQINIVSVSPHVLNELNKLTEDKLSGIRLFLSGGDALKKEYISELIKYGLVYNTYGPSEATVCASYYKCSDTLHENVLIGKPISNYTIHILDQNLNQLPIGVPGEIFISGEAVTRCYLNKPDITIDKYLNNPYSGSRMYKTGDMGRWLWDGNIEFMGRKDNQIKIRGYRIELQQIESAILRFDNVKEAFVMDREDKYGVKYLCAYMTSDHKLDIFALKQYLLAELPAYMVPAYLIQLDLMPMTLNGFKVEKSELPDPHEGFSAGIDYVAPKNEIQRRISNIWREVLGITHSEIGIYNNFFDLGGHSLNAMKVVSSINKEFKLNLPLSIIFDFMTIDELSHKISEFSANKYSILERQPIREYYPVSTAQRRIYLSQQFDERGTSYNIPMALLINGELNKTDITNILQNMTDRHESFRTSFEIVNDELMQKVNPNVQFKMHYLENANENIDELIEELIQPFDLSIAPLVRGYLIQIGTNKHLLFMDMHHIISDGISMDIIAEEFRKLYMGENLEPLKIQYKDFAMWQNNLIHNDLIVDQRDYWKDQLKGELPIIDLPLDYPRPDHHQFNGAKIYFDIGQELSSKLKVLTENEGVTLYVILLAAYNVLLAKYTNNPDIIVGSPVIGRTHPDTYGIVGMFINTLPLRNYPEEAKTFHSFLQEVKTNTLKSFENQDYPIDLIMEQINSSDHRRRALYDTLFTMQNTNLKEMKVGKLDISIYPIKSKTSKMDLIWDVIEVGENIRFSLEYCTDIFVEETVKEFIIYFKNILNMICENIEIKIKDIELLSNQEKAEINNKIQILQPNTTIDFEF
ncbi:amino acid adenylation domain-containing protein [Paenibacillus sp. M1]|uniref:Amino acid adenylation domain-containing protein n=1 Tax=Paenibacillus haidiansis TaxID=1574488 RepID=A0ABU7VQP6_9BACL